jgi:hypothetical protein
MTVSWSAQTEQVARHGSAATRTEAWRLAFEAAVTLAADTTGTEVLVLAVGTEVAHLFPATDGHRYDADATRQLTRRLLDEMEGAPDGGDAPMTVPRNRSPW